jgi:hypothetical protein
MSVGFIDEHTFFKITEKELSLSEIDKSNLYHEIDIIINNNDSDSAIKKILLLIQDLLKDRKINMASKFIDRSEGKIGKLFNRVG